MMPKNALRRRRNEASLLAFHAVQPERLAEYRKKTFESRASQMQENGASLGLVVGMDSFYAGFCLQTLISYCMS